MSNLIWNLQEPYTTSSDMARYHRFSLYFFLAATLSSCLEFTYLEIPETPQTRKSFTKERQTALQDYLDNYIGSTVKEVPWTGDVVTGDPGETPDFVKQKVLQRVNYFRRLAGLPDSVVLSAEKNKKCQQAALMFRANETVSHYPPEEWLHFTPEGRQAASMSNIYYGKGGPRTVTGYIKEPGENNYNVGHRRWLLYPRLVEVGTGDTPNTNALWVIGDFGPEPDSLPEFVAYPPKGYVPSTLIFERWSFTIKNADFSNAKISMTDHDGEAIGVKLEKLDNRPIGDRTIVWIPQGLDFTTTDDQVIRVKISNVVVDGETKNFSYETIAFNPDVM